MFLRSCDGHDGFDLAQTLNMQHMVLDLLALIHNPVRFCLVPHLFFKFNFKFAKLPTGFWGFGVLGFWGLKGLGA